MPDLECRVAKLEQAVEGLRDMIAEEKLETKSNNKQIFETLDELNSTLKKQSGFVGGVVFTVGAVFSFVTWFISSRWSG